MQTNLDHWDVATEFSPQQAAALIAGIDPAHPHAEWWRAQPAEERMREAYENAILQYAQDLDAPYDPATLSSTTLKNVVALIKDGKPEFLDFEIWRHSNGAKFKDQKFDRNVLARWLDENAIPSEYRFAGDRPESSVQKEQSALGLVAMLLDLMLEKRNGKTRSGYESQDAIALQVSVRAVEVGIRGLSESSVQKRFAEANKLIPKNRKV